MRYTRCAVIDTEYYITIKKQASLVFQTCPFKVVHSVFIFTHYLRVKMLINVEKKHYVAIISDIEKHIIDVREHILHQL